MYIHPVNQQTIVSFIHGVDCGRHTEPLWTKLLREFISFKYDINGGPLGWPNQVKRYSKKENLSWVEAFKRLMIELIEESEQITLTDEHKALKEGLLGSNNSNP